MSLTMDHKDSSFGDDQCWRCSQCATRTSKNSVKATSTVKLKFLIKWFCDRFTTEIVGIPSPLAPGDIVSLTGPAQSLIAYDSFIIYVNLVCEYNNRLFVGEAISSNISWSSYSTAGKYDMPLSREIRGLFGFVTVNYVVLRDAVSAIVEVRLINREKEKENCTNVYGTLTARNSKFLDGSVESVLFRKKMGEEIDVRPGQLIPLSRSLVAVPSDSSLIIEANLCDSFMDEIVEGIAEFPAQLTGTSERDISYEYGGIIVKVTWVT